MVTKNAICYLIDNYNINALTFTEFVTYKIRTHDNSSNNIANNIASDCSNKKLPCFQRFQLQERNEFFHRRDVSTITRSGRTGFFFRQCKLWKCATSMKTENCNARHCVPFFFFTIFLIARYSYEGGINIAPLPIFQWYAGASVVCVVDKTGRCGPIERSATMMPLLLYHVACCCISIVTFFFPRKPCNKRTR